MNEYGKVIIIHNKNVLAIGKYEHEVINNHLDAFIDFSNKYNLGYHFTNDDSQFAPITLAKDGHLIVKSVNNDELVIFYIPRVITDKQIEWYQYNYLNYFRASQIGGFSIQDDDEIKQIIGLTNINREIKKKNILYMKEVGNNVRKEI